MDENNDYEDNIAMACIATTSIFGLISNGLALYMTRSMSHFRNAFGILCSSFLICNLQAIFVLFVWSIIVLTVKSPLLSSPELFLVRLIGVFVNGGWFGALFVHFFIALNRLCAVVYPMKYKKLWSEAKALVTGIFSWTLGMTVCMIHLYNNIALACIATTSIFGLISNGFALYMTRSISRFRNTFGILCSSFLICNLQAIFVLFVWSIIETAT
uniref:G_PROTEIN_RECEP_F1_2 domain-containing protein n=1 Tax=Onchocerca volvulus TaxID=6282 RepID=A0A8R1XNX9_ONCVO